jgi:hypothetical protein
LKLITVKENWWKIVSKGITDEEFKFMSAVIEKFYNNASGYIASDKEMSDELE